MRKFSFLEGMYNPKVLLLALNYFGIVVASLGILFFVPQMIKSIGVTDNMTVGWLTMIPYVFGGLGLVGWGFVSDRMGERRWNLLAACVVSAIGLVIAGMTIGSWWALVGLSIATFGFYGSKGPFWSMPPMFMTGTAAAASIAWINSIGNLGGFFGPWYVGVIKDWTEQLRRRRLWPRLLVRDFGRRLRAVPGAPEPGGARCRGGGKPGSIAGPPIRAREALAGFPGEACRRWS